MTRETTGAEERRSSNGRGGKKKTDKAKGGISDISCFSFSVPFIPDHPSNPNPKKIMASREGINPLRPYYIPQSGLSPTPNVTQETSPSPSSPQVFGSSARDLIPDIDYSDYLDSSPSVSGWCRDIINSSLARYGQILIAQPFEVAKIILQVYVVSDNVEEDRRSNPGAGSSSYDSVHISHTLSTSQDS